MPHDDVLVTCFPVTLPLYTDRRVDLSVALPFADIREGDYYLFYPDAHGTMVSTS